MKVINTAKICLLLLGLGSIGRALVSLVRARAQGIRERFGLEHLGRLDGLEGVARPRLHGRVGSAEVDGGEGEG